MWVRQALRQEQLRVNLLGNAVKFTEYDQIVVAANARPAGPDRVTLANDYLLVSRGVKQSLLIDWCRQKQAPATGLVLRVSSKSY